jgi:hypothetical protein
MASSPFPPEDGAHRTLTFFASLFGLQTSVGQIVSTTARNGMPLHLGWIHGDEKYLTA